MRLTKPGRILIPLLVGSLLTFAVGRASAQTQPVRARITEAVDETNLVQLRGNVHPLARAEFDQGLVDDSQPMNRMLLLLQRSPEQQAALSNLMEEQLTKSSPNYHKWLTPEQFGRQFGPADADIQAVTDWLTHQGFQGIKVGAGRTAIEFSGNVGQVRNAFHTELHRLMVKGEEHVANVSDPQIPAALTPVVRGIVGLHNFAPKPHFHRLGTFRRTKATGEVSPLTTLSPGGQIQFLVGPGDFATIYSVQPLYAAATPIDGTGQTIGIVTDSNINVQDVADFRHMFGLDAKYPANNVTVIVNGPDPGVNGDEIEADLDVQWSGAVAPAAQVKLVVTEQPQSTTGGASGVDLSAVYIIDNNLASVMSESFGTCEAGLGNAGNQFENSLWEQAAAQGITVMVSAGDNGSAGCDPTATSPNAATLGLAVSGNASTPFNVAVGGTDFNQTSTTATTFWNTTNNSTTQASAKGYIPETTWNASCAAGGQASTCSASKISSDNQNNSGVDVVAGSGGPSNCVTQAGNGACTAGYSKPTWQSGTGVPTDGVRDIPDVSLFASNGIHGSTYIICQMDANTGTGSSTSSCDINSPFNDFQGVGGTSASSPTFAAIIALVNQKTGQRQGNVNYVLYPMASKTGATCTSTANPAPSCIFYDIPSGSNISVACAGGSPNCSNTNGAANQFGIMTTVAGGSIPAFNTTAGYDLATGLGSVNAANLVNNWAAASFRPTNTTLLLNAGTAVNTGHGSPVPVSITVAPGSGAGTPTGLIELIQGTASTGPVIDVFTLTSAMNGIFTGTTNMLPGTNGTPYQVLAHYGGDGTFAASNSGTQTVNSVLKEQSLVNVSLVTFDSSGRPMLSTSAMSLPYGTAYILRVDVTNSSRQQCSSVVVPCPTGNVTLLDKGSPLKDFLVPNTTTATNTASLNNAGFAEDQPIQLNASATPHSITATYAGDGSYAAQSSSNTLSVTITQAGTTMMVTSNVATITSGGSVTLTATIATQSSGVAPGGTLATPVQFLNGTTPITGTVTFTATDGSANNFASTTWVLTTTLSALGIPDTSSPWRPKLPPGLFWLLVCCALLYGFFLWNIPPARRRGYAYAGLAVFALAAAGIAGCGGGGGSKTPQPRTVTITAKFAGDSNYTASSGTTTITVQ
jgi:hypothetical protein